MALKKNGSCDECVWNGLDDSTWWCDPIRSKGLRTCDRFFDAGDVEIPVEKKDDVCPNCDREVDAGATKCWWCTEPL